MMIEAGSEPTSQRVRINVHLMAAPMNGCPTHWRGMRRASERWEEASRWEGKSGHANQARGSSALAKHLPAVIVWEILAQDDLAAFGGEDDASGHKAGGHARAFGGHHGRLDHLAARGLGNVSVPVHDTYPELEKPNVLKDVVTRLPLSDMNCERPGRQIDL